MTEAEKHFLEEIGTRLRDVVKRVELVPLDSSMDTLRSDGARMTRAETHDGLHMCAAVDVVTEDAEVLRRLKDPEYLDTLAEGFINALDVYRNRRHVRG